MKRSILLFAAGAMFLAACSSQVYNNTSYISANSLQGKKLAILPVDVEFTGRLPKGYSLEKKVTDENSESVSIQNLIYSQYLYNSSKSGKKQEVEMMNIDQVNSALRKNNISVRDSWNMNPDSLGKLVGADLVLKVRVKKDRIMSEAAALGVDVVGNILNGVLNKGNNGIDPVPSGNSKTYKINLSATLSDASNHTVITKFSREGSADWNTSPERVIKDTGRKVVKKGVVYAQD